MAYLNTLLNGFVYDDNLMIVQNRWIRDLSSIPDIFSSSLWGFRTGGESNYYRPLVHLVFMAEYAVFGLRPWPYHLVNVVFHAANSVLVFMLAFFLFGFYSGPASAAPQIHGHPRPDRGGVTAFISALIFALHPVHVEAVAPVSVVAELTYCFFYLLTVLFHIRRALEPGPRRRVLFYLFSVTSFAMGIFLKEAALTAITVMAAFDIIFPARKGPVRDFIFREVIRFLPYAAIFVIYLLIRREMLGGIVPLRQHTYLTNYQYFLSVFPLLADYMRLLFFPTNLSAFYTFHPVLSFFDLSAIVSMGTVLVCAALVFIYRSNRVVLFSAAWFFLSLGPVLYIPGVGGRGTAFAERYLYIPSAGFVIIAAALVYTVYKRLNPSPLAARAFIFGAVFSVSAVFLYMTVERNAVWRDNYSLWKDTSSKTRDSEVVYVNLGEALFKRGRLSEAEGYFREALRLNGNSFEANKNLGAALSNMSRPAEAVPYLRRAVEIYPGSAEALNSLGNALTRLGRLNEAQVWSLKAIELDPGLAEAHTTLGIILATKGDTVGAIEHLKTALRLNPGDPVVHYNIAVAYIKANMVDEAVAHFKEVVRLSPADTKAQRDLEKAERLRERRGR